jgi:hypothetical protein
VLRGVFVRGVGRAEVGHQLIELPLATCGTMARPVTLLWGSET